MVDALELGRELVLPACVGDVHCGGVGLVHCGEVSLAVGDVCVAALACALSLDMHTAETNVEATVLSHDGPPYESAGECIALGAGLVGALGEGGVVGEHTILEPQGLVGDGVHDTDAAAGLVDVALRLVHVLLL